jgi:hypothetical protein
MINTKDTKDTKVWLFLCVLGVLCVSRLSAQSAPPPPTQIGSIKVPADTIEIRGSHAYVAGGRTLTVLDLSDPASPKKAGEYTFPEQIWSFRIVGSDVYVAANFFGLGILDISKPASPVLRTSFKTPGQAKGVAVIGSTVFVADHMSGVDVVDITSPDKPVGRGSFFVDGYARDVATSSRFGYAVDAPTGLYVLDPSKPGTADAVGQLQSAAAPQMIEVLEHAGRVIACVVGGGSFQTYDVTVPEKHAPARDVALGGGLVLVAVGMGEGNEEVVVLR